MTKKKVLKIKYEPEFEIIGLFAGIKNYRLCWFMNKVLSLEFKRLSDISLTAYQAKSTDRFSLFFSENKELQISYFLLNNYNGSNILIPEPKNLDFLLLLKSNELRLDVNYLVKKLRDIPQVATAIRIIEPSKIKNLNNVLYDLEFGLLDMKL